ncbi:unnamed protein product [Spodoptera exigua]|nr:unnamed protein product [Spodoptera exigua]
MATRRTLGSGSGWATLTHAVRGPSLVVAIEHLSIPNAWSAGYCDGWSMRRSTFEASLFLSLRTMASAKAGRERPPLITSLRTRRPLCGTHKVQDSIGPIKNFRVKPWRQIQNFSLQQRLRVGSHLTIAP